LKLLQILDGYPPEHTGGIASYVRFESTELRRCGHDVTILTRRHAAATSEVSEDGGLRVIRHSAPLVGSRLYYAHPFLTAHRLASFIRRLHIQESFDAICVHNTFHAAALVRARTGARTVFRCHAPASAEIELDASSGKYGLKGRVLGRVLGWVDAQESLALTHIGKVATLSNFMADELRRVHPRLARQIEVIPGAVDLERFAFSGSTDAAKARLGIPPERPTLLSVRRLVGRMGIEGLLEAMVTVGKSVPDALLIVVGKGYLRTHLERVAEEHALKDRVSFVGFVADEDLPTYYQASDLFVLPTEQLEGFGMVTLEAMASGTPVVATSVGANPEVVGAFDKDLVSRVNLAGTILEGLRKGAEPDYRRSCREHVESRYSVERVLGAVEQMLS
jgi:glycosyltransferase involved in cell wall biosynthesis